MQRLALKGNIVLPTTVLAGGVLAVEDEQIAGVYRPDEKIHLKGFRFVDYGDHFIAPGLIDLHVHGAVGKDVMDGDVESLKSIASHQARCGVTGFVPTTLAAALPDILKAVAAVKLAKKKPLPSEMLGIHLEGPFLSLQKKGAQNQKFIKAANSQDIDSLAGAVAGLRTIITIAPEFGENLSLIPLLKEKGMIVSIGHSEASYELAMKSFEQGISHATHLFNAMTGFLPREPGTIGAVLEAGTLTAEIIADGIHVHPAALRLAVRAKGVEKICLITDSVKASGLGDGDYLVGNLEVVVRDGQARLKESSALAGSVLTLNRAVGNIIGWTGMPVSQAVSMASKTPARVLGIEGEMGSVEAGKLANLAVFDRQFAIVETILRGQPVLKRDF